MTIGKDGIGRDSRVSRPEAAAALNRRGRKRWLSGLAMLSALMMMGLLAGCLTQSIHPIYSEETLVVDERLIGSFEDDGGVWSFSRDGDSSYTAIHVSEEGSVVEFEAHLAEINDALVLDLYPEEWPVGAGELLEFFTVPVHWFFRVDGMDDVLILVPMDTEWVEDHLRTFPGVIDHAFIDDRVVLTGETDRLQAFVGAHVRNADAWEDSEEFVRLPVTMR